MRTLVFLLLAVGIIHGCKESSRKGNEDNNEYKPDLVFGDTQYNFPTLSNPAQEFIVKWGVMEDFIADTKRMNGSDFQMLKNLSERLSGYSDSIFKNVPDTLDINPVQGRLLVVKTRTALLKQVTQRSMIDSAEIQHSVMELNDAVKNLIVHLNEKFQKDQIDLQRKENEQMELQKQKRFRDSVLQIGLQDIKKK